MLQIAESQYMGVVMVSYISAWIFVRLSKQRPFEVYNSKHVKTESNAQEWYRKAHLAQLQKSREALNGKVDGANSKTAWWYKELDPLFCLLAGCDEDDDNINRNSNWRLYGRIILHGLLVAGSYLFETHRHREKERNRHMKEEWDASALYCLFNVLSIKVNIILQRREHSYVAIRHGFSMLGEYQQSSFHHRMQRATKI